MPEIARPPDRSMPSLFVPLCRVAYVAYFVAIPPLQMLVCAASAWWSGAVSRGIAGLLPTNAPGSGDPGCLGNTCRPQRLPDPWREQSP